jgi:NTP pyrophosphatase (non-canonical NTP hydrolase)
MQVSDYQMMATRTAKAETMEQGLFHASLGLAGEVGELCDAVKKHLIYGQKADIKNIIEELGDVAWYLAYFSEKVGVSLETVFRMNIEKLQTRYPEQYTDELAALRLDKEVDDGC